MKFLLLLSLLVIPGLSGDVIGTSATTRTPQETKPGDTGTTRSDGTVVTATKGGDTATTRSGTDTDTTKSDGTVVTATKSGDSATTRSGTGSDATTTESGSSGCTTGYVSSDDLCYYSCNLDSGTYSKLGAMTTYGDKERMLKLDAVCKERNTELKTCAISDIVPTTIDGCGCGRCVERCEVEGTRRFRYKTSDGTIKCRQITCSTRTVTIEPSDSLSGVTTIESYENIRRTITETDVEITKCDYHTDERTTSTPIDIDTFCQDPCSDGEPAFCMYDSTGSVYKTFKCAAAFKCAMRDTSISSDRYRLANYGPCREAPDDECTLGVMRVTDVYVSNSKCGRVCNCIASLDANGGNYEICDTMERNFENIKKKCATKLNIDCSFENLYFAECPDPDGDICANLFCEKDKIPDVCRTSSETYKDGAVYAKTDDNECYYTECDKDTTSATYGELVDKIYSGTDRDSKGIISECPTLADCTQVEYNINKICGVCPTCPEDPDDDSCDKNELKRDDKACLDDPDDDDTRDKPDGTRDDFAAKVRIKAAIKICGDEFFGYTRTDHYDFIKAGAMTVARSCDNIEADDLIALRAYIRYFNYEIVDKLSTDSCDVMIKVVFRVDLCDTDIARLRKLLTCFKELKEDDTVDIRARIAAEIKSNVKGTRFSADATSTDPTALDTTGAGVTSTSDAALISITNMDDTEFDTVTTTASGDDPHGTVGNAVGYTIIVAVWTSFIALLY